MKYIIERSIKPVWQFNKEMLDKQQYIMVMTLGNGSMVDMPRKRGYVVSKEHKEGGKSSRFFLNHDKAFDWYSADKLA